MSRRSGDEALAAMDSGSMAREISPSRNKANSSEEDEDTGDKDSQQLMEDLMTGLETCIAEMREQSGGQPLEEKGAPVDDARRNFKTLVEDFGSWHFKRRREALKVQKEMFESKLETARKSTEVELKNQKVKIEFEANKKLLEEVASLQGGEGTARLMEQAVEAEKAVAIAAVLGSGFTAGRSSGAESV